MSAWKKLLAAVIVLSAFVFFLANLLLHQIRAGESGRPYRVEINRAALAIEEQGLESVDLSQYEYLYRVERFNASPDSTDGDYAVREIDGVLYRFDYVSGNAAYHSQITAAVNGILAFMTAFVIAVVCYVRAAILRPFERLAAVPHELSRGNLSVPVRETGNGYFGKFLWGIDLLREKLEQQKQRELKLQKEKKTLLLSLSHDVKTPLAAIKLYAAALAKNLYPDERRRREIAESIGTKVDEIEGYISGIITASREDFLSFEIENGEFYLSELAGTIAAYYTEKLSLVKTDFIVGKYRNCLLRGDPDRSVEVLQNVMENALKYGDGRYVELSFSEEDEGVLIEVKNGGCTLERSELAHIFESFRRGANAQNVQGSGLGLYICRQLMHGMGGEIFAKIDGDAITVTIVFGRA